jgi:hypothetical protein
MGISRRSKAVIKHSGGLHDSLATRVGFLGLLAMQEESQVSGGMTIVDGESWCG